MAAWQDPQIYDLVLTHKCGYAVHVHAAMHGWNVKQEKLSEVMLSWDYTEVTYRDTDGQEITYCPGCGETFLVQGRIERASI